MMDILFDPDTLDIRRRWAEMFCTNPVIWRNLAEEYRIAGRLSMADYCARHADFYAGKDEHEIAIYPPPAD